jgi:phosphate transport system substrate-binding protein
VFALRPSIFTSHGLLAARVVAAIALTFLAGSAASRAEVIRMNGSPAVSMAITFAGPALKEKGIEIKVTVESGSANAATALGHGAADIAMMLRPISNTERAQFPDKRFVEERIGSQAIALLVPRDVWEGGVRSITKNQVIGIYEGSITSWKELGGEDKPIKYYNSERNRGIWEFFAQWAYGDQRKAPLGTQFESVVGGEDARNTVEFNAGSCAFAPPRWADGRSVFALAIKDESGAEIEPTAANIVSLRYPLARPVMLAFASKPLGPRKRILEFMLSEAGQALLTKTELVPLDEVGRPAAPIDAAR